MRVKKYKRVKRPKVYAGLPGSAEEEDGGEPPLLTKPSTSSRSSCSRPEQDDDAEQDADTEDLHRAVDGRSPRSREAQISKEKSDGTKDRSPRDHGAEATGEATSADYSHSPSIESFMPEDAGSKLEKVSKSNDIVFSTGHRSAEVATLSSEKTSVSGPQVGNANRSETIITRVVENKSRESPTPTPRTIPCSDEGSTNSNSPHCNGDAKHDDAHPDGSANSESTEYDGDDHSSIVQEEDGGSVSRFGAGSLWFKAERVACFLQLLALALDVEGAEWPPLFFSTWGWTWFTTEYLRWPMLVLLRRVGRAFSLTFGEQGHDLWVFRDVVGYGVEVCIAFLAVFTLFFVLQMPDYTSHKAQAAWKRRFLTHWFRSSLPLYVINLCLAYGSFAALMKYGASVFPDDVVIAVTVVGGTVVTVSWMLVVGFSFLVHINLRLATKHDVEYSLMIAMKHVIKIKIRACLLFLHLAYVPVSASIMRALLPIFDWNDNWAPDSRKPYNHHTWCYFLGFPPQTVGTAENSVLECTSLSGVSVHTLSACLLLLYTWGLPNLVRYLVRVFAVAFERNDDVIRSFVQAREAHHAALLPLDAFPKDALWLARRRRELKLARRITCRAGRRILRALSTGIRRVPVVRRLPCLRKRRRRRKKVEHDEFHGFDHESGGAYGHTGIDGKGAHAGRIIDVDKDREQQNENSNGVGMGAMGEGTLPNHDGSGLMNTPKTISSSPFSADGGGERPAAVQIRPGTTDKPLSKAAAAAMAKATAEQNAAIAREGRDHRNQRAAQSIAGCFGDYLDRRTLACMGLESALEAEREACDNAREEYILALLDFESDHSLEITCWESVVDTSGLLCLCESYTWLRPDWKFMECLERGMFVAGMLVTQLIGAAAAQLLVGALVLIFFQIFTLRAEPFLRLREAWLDSVLRVVLILVLLIGSAGGFLWSAVGDTFLLVVGAIGITAALCLGDAIGATAAVARKGIAAADNHVNDLLFHQVKQRSLGLEVSHTGIRLLMQWDDLLEQQRWSAFLAWPSPTPAAILTKREKLLLVRWAAFRGIDVRRARSTTTLSLLHDAIISAEVEPARWLVYLYPVLLDAETLHKESPLLLGMLETARILLRIETVQVLIEKLESLELDNMVRGSGAGAGWLAGQSGEWAEGGGSGNERKERSVLEEELAELCWKRGRLMEIFLSNELQNADVRWNAHQYELLTEHGEPDLAELAQHLAQAFHLKPPKGYAPVHRWRKRASPTRDYLGEATCSSTKELEFGDCGLGDTGYKTLLSVCRALSSQATTFTWPSTYVTEFPITVVRLNLSGNRMRRKSGYRLADMLLLNKTVTDLDASNNSLDSQAASELFFAVRKNRVLKKLNLKGNKIGPEVSSALADMISKNQSLVYLDLSDNSMGDRKFWVSRSEFAYVPSAGPALGEALRFNKTLAVLKLKGNRLGPESGRAFANGVAKHQSLTSLDLSGNFILPAGGKALALRLSSAARSSIVCLDMSDNHLGNKVAKLFSAMLKKNRTLRHLDLARNELTTQAGIALAGALRVNRSLAFLSLAGNAVGPKAGKALAQALSENSTLTGADLSDNTLGVATADGGDPNDVGLAFGIGLRSNATLTSLNLRGNRFPALEIQHIAEAMGDHPSLAHLDFHGESVNDSTALDLARLAASGRLLTINLARSALAGAGAAAIARSLSTARGLLRLDLCDNSLGDAAARALASSLSAEGFVVRQLGLARCGLGPVCGTLVATALGDNRSVEELDLADNGLGAEAGLALAKSLRVLYRNGKEVRPCRMVRLDLSLNSMGNEAGVAILGALLNGCTQHLDMSYTALRGVAAGKAIGRMLRCHTIALKFFNAEHNALGREGINEVFWALRRNTSLVHLDVSDNGAGPAFGTEADKLQEYGTTSINSALSLNQTIRFLDLGTNGLSAECGTTLTASIRKNRSLTHINLENNALDDEAGSMMARKLRKDRQIEHLNLNNNNIGWKGGLDLADALGVNKHLMYLDVGKNSLGDAGTFAGIGGVFGDMLVRNHTLTHLNLEGNRLGPTAGVAIAKALHRNISIVNLNLEDNRFDQDVGFALEDLLNVNFSLRTVGASTGEIGLDCRFNIDAMLAAREKLLETHGLSAPPGSSANSFAAGSGGGNNRSPYYSDSGGSAGSVGGRSGAEGGGGDSRGRGRKPGSARALRAKQAAMVAARKASMSSGGSSRQRSSVGM